MAPRHSHPWAASLRRSRRRQSEQVKCRWRQQHQHQEGWGGRPQRRWRRCAFDAARGPPEARVAASPSPCPPPSALSPCASVVTGGPDAVRAAEWKARSAAGGGGGGCRARPRCVDESWLACRRRQSTNPANGGGAGRRRRASDAPNRDGVVGRCRRRRRRHRRRRRRLRHSCHCRHRHRCRCPRRRPCHRACRVAPLVVLSSPPFLASLHHGRVHPQASTPPPPPPPPWAVCCPSNSMGTHPAVPPPPPPPPPPRGPVRRAGCKVP